MILFFKLQYSSSLSIYDFWTLLEGQNKIFVCSFGKFRRVQLFLKWSKLSYRSLKKIFPLSHNNYKKTVNGPEKLSNGYLYFPKTKINTCTENFHNLLTAIFFKCIKTSFHQNKFYVGSIFQLKSKVLKFVNNYNGCNL